MLFSFAFPEDISSRTIECTTHAEALDAIAKEVASKLLLEHVYLSSTPYKTLLSYMRTSTDVNKKEFVSFALQSARIVQNFKRDQNVPLSRTPSPVVSVRSRKRCSSIECLKDEMDRMHIRKKLTVIVPDDE